jgi:predicted metal-dependent phosphoesterase TrpH
LIDLHTHTTASDGTYTPRELVDAALRLGLEALAITDHDTFDGFDQAVPHAAAGGLRLLCGIEVGTRLRRPAGGRSQSVHLLGYFADGPTAGFRDWIATQQRIRHERNVALAERLREIGIDIHLDEVRHLGRNMTGRPHFARVLLQKGYVSTIQEAFDRYLDVGGAAYVEKHDPDLDEGVAAIHSGGGVASLAHPVRVGLDARDEQALLDRLVPLGLGAVEAVHSDHPLRHQSAYRELARRNGLRLTGGSDFHGANKPDIALGTGRRGNVSVPLETLEALFN